MVNSRKRPWVTFLFYPSSVWHSLWVVVEIEMQGLLEYCYSPKCGAWLLRFSPVVLTSSAI